MIRLPTFRRGALAATMSLTMMLAACSGEATQEVDDREAVADPPGAAAALSLGGRVSSEGDSEFDIAVNCAAALRITSKTLVQMTSGPESQEIQMIDRTASIFGERADELRSSNDASGASARAAIESRISEKSESAGEQAQLAIACLRKMEDEL